MLGNAGVYAVKRRKKPVQKSAQPPPVKTNPSKRHRDRLNVELDYLTSLLPFSEEVRGRLDKLSVLRLSVGYLKVKSYFHRAAPQNNSASAPPVSSNGRNGRYMSLDGVSFSEGEFLLQSLNGFVLVVATDGTVFYTSPTIQDFLGFHQSDVVHQSVYDLIHVDDREMFHCQLQIGLQSCETDMRTEDVQSSRAAAGSSPQLLPGFLPPENSFFLERSFCCRLRCLLDNTSGFMVPESRLCSCTLALQRAGRHAVLTPMLWQPLLTGDTVGCHQTQKLAESLKKTNGDPIWLPQEMKSFRSFISHRKRRVLMNSGLTPEAEPFTVVLE